MPGNTIGKMFTVTTFGESHGPAIGCIVDGCPPNVELTTADIQTELYRRRPGQNKFTSPRNESDQIKILSGVFEGKTTGTPICLQIENLDQRPKDYSALKDQMRPGHGDASYQAKYGIRDYRGGGRASARETAMRVAAGAIAKKYLREFCDTQISAFVSQIGDIKSDHDNLDIYTELLEQVLAEQDSIGAAITLRISNPPAGLGEPVFDKLDADLAHALMSINAVKGVELGEGFACVQARGSHGFAADKTGGILAGISDGNQIIARLAFKPTSSIRLENGRHDPCVGIRAVPIVEAMAAIVLLDHLLRHRGQNGIRSVV